jgi:hypothetical protein
LLRLGPTDSRLRNLHALAARLNEREHLFECERTRRDRRRRLRARRRGREDAQPRRYYQNPHMNQSSIAHHFAQSF